LSDGRALAERFPLARFFRVGVLPITLSFPFGLWLGLPPPYVPLFVRARVRALSPIHFTRAGERAASDEAYVEACHRIVVHAMQATLDELAKERRAERRRGLHARLDALVDRFEQWTGAQPVGAAPTPAREATVLPMHTPATARISRPSRPSLPPRRAA
jgi:hypothetical protein